MLNPGLYTLVMMKTDIYVFREVYWNALKNGAKMPKSILKSMTGEVLDEHRIELMESLRNAGFHIELMNESCQHYAVIDNEIVWYGSMNLLSKDDIEDSKLHEFQLPL